MSKENWHKEMDDWLNDAMDDLPNPKVADWESFDAKRNNKKHKKGLLWFSTTLALLLIIGFVYRSDIGFNKEVKIEKASTGVKTKENDVTSTKEELKANSTKQEEEINIRIEENTVTAKSTINGSSFEIENNMKLVKSNIENAAEVNSIPQTQEQKTLAELDPFKSSIPVETENVVFTSYVDANNEVEKTEPKTIKEQRTAQLSMGYQSTDSIKNTSLGSTEEGLFDDDKWSINLSMYPNYTFRDLKVTGANQEKVHKDYLGIVNSSEKGGMAINVGADVKYKVARDIFVGSGLYYIQTKITGTYEFEITEDAIVDGSGNIIGYQPAPEGTYVNQGIVNNYSYIQIPLVVSYQPWLNKRLRMVVEGGTSYLRFLKARGTTIDYQTLRPVKLEDLEYNKDLFTVNFKIGVNYYLSEQLAVGLEPTFLYFNNTIYGEEYPISMVPWSVGVNFSIKIRIQ